MEQTDWTVLHMHGRNRKNKMHDKRTKACQHKSDHQIFEVSGTFIEKYEYSGYRLPNIVFWNVNSRHDLFHVDSKRKTDAVFQR